MNINRIEQNGISIAVVKSKEVIIENVGDALDLMATVGHEAGCHNLVIGIESITEEFFSLSTGIAGEILQKFVTYRFKLAIIGDFSCYSSKPLRDFIYESNRGKHIFFLETEEEAIEKLSS